MFGWLMKILSSCCEPVKRYIFLRRDEHDATAMDENSAQSELEDPLLKTMDLEKHSVGEFSLAVIQANGEIEDHNRVETAPGFLFVGVYDGHGGPEASRYVHEHLFHHLIRFALKHQAISEEVLKKAISTTEEGFISLVREKFKRRPLIAAAGSCCLVGVIWNRTLYIANIGDSRVILGSLMESYEIEELIVEPLTKDQNARRSDVREELKLMHPHDPYIVQNIQGQWFVKGMLQVPRAIGDAYLKAQEFSLNHVRREFYLPQPLLQPAITAIPALSSRVLRPADRFLIFASDGLWDCLTNDEAADIVQNNPQEGVARKLVEAALRRALERRGDGTELADLKNIRKGVRRSYHDDITVVVVFLDHEKMQGEDVPVSQLSGLIDAAESSSSEARLEST